MTEKQVDRYIRDAVSCTAEAILEFIEKDTRIVDKDSGIEIPNAEIDLSEDFEKHSILEKYIWPKLAEKGIIFYKSK